MSSRGAYDDVSVEVNAKSPRWFARNVRQVCDDPSSRSGTDRFATFEVTALNVHIDFALFQRLGLPILAGHTRVPGIKIHDTHMVRLMEALLHSGTQIHGWKNNSAGCCLLPPANGRPPVAASRHLRSATLEEGGTRLGPTGSLERNVKFGFT